MKQIKNKKALDKTSILSKAFLFYTFAAIPYNKIPSLSL
mgnify:CR=1 FL=1